MGYATIQLVDNILAQSLTSATNTIVNGAKVPLVSFGTVRNQNQVSDNIINQYIQWSDDEVDGALSEMYRVPLCEKADLELSMLFDISEYNSALQLDKAINLVPGDTLVIFDDIQEERHIVDLVSDNITVDLIETLVGSYDSTGSRVLRVKFPPPIPMISARLAAANIYDKYFAAQVSPNTSDYGTELRGMAIRDLNNILNGRTVLHGQKRIGHRFLNPNLRDRYRLPGTKFDQDSSRDIGKTK